MNHQSMNQMIKGLVLFGIVSAVSGCSTPPRKRAPEPFLSRGPVRTSNESLASLLGDTQRLLQNFEMTVVLPQEEDPAVRKLTLESQSSKIKGRADSSRKQLWASPFTIDEFENLVSLIRQIDEKELSTSPKEGCIEPYLLTFHVGSEKRQYFGCRGSGVAASVVSRWVRSMEFLLIQHSSKL